MSSIKTYYDVQCDNCGEMTGEFYASKKGAKELSHKIRKWKWKGSKALCPECARLDKILKDL